MIILDSGYTFRATLYTVTCWADTIRQQILIKIIPWNRLSLPQTPVLLEQSSQHLR